MRSPLQFVLLLSPLLLAACGDTSTSLQSPLQSAGITTLPAVTATPSPTVPGDGSGSSPVVPGQINAGNMVSTIEQQYSQNYGSTITVTCPRTGSFASTPGDSFQCNYTDASGRAGTLTVSVTSGQGDYSWTIP